MKKKFLFVALSALALTACVNDETIEVNPGDALTFRATSGNATKSQITTTSTISDFKVWGYYQNEAEKQSDVPFMEAQQVNKNGDVWTYSPTRFWPESGTIDFYSVSPSSVNASISGSSQKIENYTVNTNVSKQIDLLYAVNKDCSKAANGHSGVQVNFRHALSQIVFKAKSSNEAIVVDIKGVTLVNAKTTGTFTYPTKTTSPYDDPESTDYDTEINDGTSALSGTWGTWALESATDNYAAGVTEKKNIGSTAVDLTTAGSGELLLLPQTLTAWNPANGANDPGSRFLINCKIWNVSGTDKIRIWPAEDEYSEVAIPVEATWKQGKKYVYTFVFGDGAGYTPDGEQPSLLKVNFNVTVDKFQEGDNTEIEMGKAPIDMDEDVTTYGGGNCFVIPQVSEEGTRYSFDATKEGRTDDPVGTVVNTGKSASGAKLVAEDTEGLITDITYENGDIIVTPEVNKTGNAIVAVTDEDGTILWSWHLWIVNDNSFMTKAKTNTFMDRDLGGNSDGTKRLYYQWGNKNPNVKIQNESGPVTLEYAIKNPGFIAFKHESAIMDWCSDVEKISTNNFWKTQLDKFNPAPKGWTFPNADIFESIIEDEEALTYNDKVKEMTYNNHKVTLYKTRYYTEEGKLFSSSGRDIHSTHYFALGAQDNRTSYLTLQWEIWMEKERLYKTINRDGLFSSQGYCIRPIKE